MVIFFQTKWYNISMGILNTTKKKGIPVKKLTVCFTLTLLFALSGFTQVTLNFKLFGNAITQYGNSPKAGFSLILTGTQDTGTAKKSAPVNIHDTLNTTLSVKFTIARSCSLQVIIKKQGFLIDSSRNSLSKCDSFSWNTGANFSATPLITCTVIEKRPKITKFTNSYGSLLWKIDSSTIVDSQSIWVSSDQGITYKRIDTTNFLSSTQRSYPWTALPGTVIFKVKASNADSSDSSLYTLSTTGIKNKIVDKLIYQRASSMIFNAQGRLIYRGVDSRFPKFSTGEYFTENKTQLLLR
jgi:hypothetical protein